MEGPLIAALSMFRPTSVTRSSRTAFTEKTALASSDMKRNKDLLTYYREVLDKISTADARTFRKELRKAFR